jgi:hypothetical protein
MRAVVLGDDLLTLFKCGDHGLLHPESLIIIAFIGATAGQPALHPIRLATSNIDPLFVSEWWA